MIKNLFAGIFVLQFSLLTACSTAELNHNPQTVASVQSSAETEKFAIAHARLSEGKNGSGEVCFLRLDGIDETDLRNQDMSSLKNISPVLANSISIDAAAQLKSPELLRSLAMVSEDVAQRTSFKDLQFDLRNAAASSASQGKSCAHSAHLLKGKLSLLSEEETLNLTWGGVFGFCVWACAVSHSITGPHEWPTRSSTPWTLPSYPAKQHYKPPYWP